MCYKTCLYRGSDKSLARQRRKQATATEDFDMKRENQLEATQWFNEFVIRSTCFGHYYAHHQELETIQIITACGT
jgi:hypothetical protein